MDARPTSAIRPDERVVFFPTVGRFDEASGQWRVPIHGWIFRPEEDSRRRAVALAVLRRLFGLHAADAESELFNERLRPFLVDNRGGIAVTIHCAGRTFALPESAPNGHIATTLTLSNDMVADMQSSADVDPPGSASANRVLRFTVLLSPADEREFAGRVHLLASEGTSVVSDIDDTIKISHVRERRALFRQTFLRDFEPVHGMADVYTRWRAADAAFHYLSRSPWQLYLPLAAFLSSAGFPLGSFDMRFFRWKDRHTLRPGSDRDLKERVIRELLAAFPRRQFVLVGDSSERDPEIYGALAQTHPAQIRSIFIRNATAEPARGERFCAAFAGVDPQCWQVFSEPDELQGSRLG